jgi:pimeloyl-ACP methyl ester carboxylesterase
MDDLCRFALAALGAAGLSVGPSLAAGVPRPQPAESSCHGQAATAGQDVRTIELPFSSHDGYAMRGKLTLPVAPGRHPVVVYVQTAEAMTIDLKRRLGRERTFNYFDLYRDQLPRMGVAFFTYEGRGVRMGDQPPRFEHIDAVAYDTSTLENKVRDLLSAVEAVRARPDIDPRRVFVLGTSEGTVLAAEAASRQPKQLAGLILYGVMADAMPQTFRYIMTEGGFLTYRKYFDTDEDGSISQAEFEADPRGYRARVFRGATFSAFDRNGDGLFKADEMSGLTKPYLDAIASEDFEVLDAWARTAAGVTTPRGWFRDHFRHPALWTFLSRLDMPIAFFHGTADANTPVSSVRALEARAKVAGKRRFAFHYVEGEDHSLGVAGYFVTGTVPPGHRAIFDWMRRNVATR